MLNARLTIALLLTVAVLATSSALEDPVPFGNERLNDFFFVKNGTVFHQFVRTLFSPLVSSDSVVCHLESWSVRRYSKERGAVAISICRANGVFYRECALV